jgi:hypothetical protein
MTETPEQIMARAIAIADGEIFDGTMSGILSENEYRAQAAISALKEAGTVHAPVEPTEAMIEAAGTRLGVRVDGETHYPSARAIRNALVVAIAAIQQGKQ